jgi:WD40 repeat protein
VLAEGSLDGVAVVTQDGSNFTVAADPAAVSTQSGGVFSLTFKADDGVSVAGATASFTLSFALPTRFLVVGAGTGYYLGTYDLDQDPAPLADAAINSTIRGVAWINRELVVVNTASSSQNPQFATVRASDGLLERVFENEVAGSQGRGTSGVAASADGLWCAVALTGAPFVAFYSFSGGVPTRVTPFGSVPSAWSLEFHPTGDFCVVTDGDGAAHVFDMRSGTPTPTQYPGLATSVVLHPQFSADGTKLYFADNGRTDSKLVVAGFDPATGAISNPAPLGAITDNLQDLHVSPDGQLLCVGGPNTPIFDIGVDPVNPPEIVLGGVSYRSADDREFIFSPDMKLAALRVQAPSSARIRVFDYDAETRTLTNRSLASEAFTFPSACAFQPGSV